MKDEILNKIIDYFGLFCLCLCMFGLGFQWHEYKNIHQYDDIKQYEVKPDSIIEKPKIDWRMKV